MSILWFAIMLIIKIVGVSGLITSVMRRRGLTFLLLLTRNCVVSV